MFEERPVSDHHTRTYAMVSTYPPTQCGIATFAAALSGGLYEYGDDVEIVRVGADGEPPAKIVVAELNDGDGRRDDRRHRRTQPGRRRDRATRVRHLRRT